jgi:hypothetical protein
LSARVLAIAVPNEGQCNSNNFSVTRASQRQNPHLDYKLSARPVIGALLELAESEVEPAVKWQSGRRSGREYARNSVISQASWTAKDEHVARLQLQSFNRIAPAESTKEELGRVTD